MKKISIFVVIIVLNLSVYGKTVEVLMFDYPPLQGFSKASDIGLIPEVIKAAFLEKDVDVIFKTLPTQRVINDIEHGNGLVMIGLKEYFDTKAQESLTMYPIINLNFLFFYRKRDFMEGFSYKTNEDLKKYSISVLLNGSTHIYAKTNNINVEGVISVDAIFKKISTGRAELGVAEYLSGLNSIEKLYPEEKNQWASYGQKPFLSTTGMAIFNKNNPDYKEYNDLFREGLVKIINNGKWEEILKKFFPNKEIDNGTLKMMKDFAKKNSKTDK